MLIFVRLSVKYLDAIHHSDTFGLSISICSVPVSLLSPEPQLDILKFRTLSIEIHSTSAHT